MNSHCRARGRGEVCRRTGGDGGADGGEHEEEGGDELGEVGPEGRRREAVLQAHAEVGRHFYKFERLETLGAVKIQGNLHG